MESFGFPPGGLPELLSARSTRFSIQADLSRDKDTYRYRVEVEISAMSKQCLARRIRSRTVLDREIAQWVESRNRERARIEWRFTTQQAPQKLARHYDAITH